MVNGGIHVLIGKLKGKTKTTTQAYRYPKSSWSAERARGHCRENGGKFEAARFLTKRERRYLRRLMRIARRIG